MGGGGGGGGFGRGGVLCEAGGEIVVERVGDCRAVGGLSCTYEVDSADHLLRTVISMGSRLATVEAHVLKHSHIQ